MFGNLEFETLLISSFLVIQSKDVCCSRAWQIFQSLQTYFSQTGNFLEAEPGANSLILDENYIWPGNFYCCAKIQTKFSSRNSKCLVSVSYQQILKLKLFETFRIWLSLLSGEDPRIQFNCEFCSAGPHLASPDGGDSSSSNKHFNFPTYQPNLLLM